jgi:DNA-binding CsgD family transcriptional regulator
MNTSSPGNDIFGLIESFEMTNDLTFTILDNIDAFIFILDAEKFKPVWINRFFEKRFLFTCNELKDISAEDFLALFHPKSLQQFSNRIRFYDESVKAGDKTIYQIRSKVGEWIYMLTSSRVYKRKADGGIKYLMGYATEVSKTDLDNQVKQLNGLEMNLPGGALAEILSRRERDVIRYIAIGFTDKEIAEKLNISTHTTKTHRKRILSKLGMKNTAMLIKFAVEKGLV